MGYLLNAIYIAAWFAILPWLCWKAWVRKKPVRGLFAKWLGKADDSRLADFRGKPVAWFHGVSVGEIHLLRQVVARFRSRFPGWQIVVSTTTSTGHDEARKHFPDLPVVYWPFDFTWAVANALKTIQPTLVVLSEGEIWPNFIRAAKRNNVVVAILNGRMSPRSARRFQSFRWLLARLFGQVDWIGAQNDEYRDQYLQLGAKNVVVTGNIKYDGVNTDRDNARTRAMRALLGIAADDLVWVVGSSQDPEESLAIEIYRKAKSLFPRLRLVVVPRHPERFDEVADLLQRSGMPTVRRSAIGKAATGDLETPIFLIDTIGELGAIWGLADVAYVGGSLDGKRGGQNMIEPSAYGAAVCFGPHTWNFKQTVADLLANAAAIQVRDCDELEATVLRLLADAKERQRLGEAARRFVLSQQGATERTLDQLANLLGLSERATTAKQPPVAA